MSYSVSTIRQVVTASGTSKQYLGRDSRELAGDIILALIWMGFAWRFLTAFLAHHRTQDGLLLALECVTVGIFLTRRRARTSSSDFGDWLFALCGTATPLFLNPHPAVLIPAIGMALQLAQVLGVCFSILGLVALNRSFGIVPANRGVRADGLYAHVRHPIYAGYILTQLAYTAANPSARNFAIVFAAIAFQIIRIGNEEQHLKCDPEYREYLSRTRWRLFPFLY
jgi:protein-S-isoprenylcysteine O-methyltransferase Ste14